MPVKIPLESVLDVVDQSCRQADLRSGMLFVSGAEDFVLEKVEQIFTRKPLSELDVVRFSRGLLVTAAAPILLLAFVLIAVAHMA
jgi:hypothetical protein